jgi:hypothetical protein
MTKIDIIGFIGVGILLLAYLLHLIGKLDSKSILYLSLNCVGAGIACLASIMMNYIPFIILEGTWTLVSVMGLVKSWTKD